MSKFWKEEFSEETLQHIKLVKEAGLNLWPLMGRYKKKSRLSEPLPDEVIQAVCRTYLEMGEKIDKSFPYFLRVLEQMSRDYFADQQKKEHQKYKDAPVKLSIRLGE